MKKIIRLFKLFQLLLLMLLNFFFIYYLYFFLYSLNFIDKECKGLFGSYFLKTIIENNF